MGEKRRRGLDHPSQPESRAFGLLPQALEFATNPPNKMSVDLSPDIKLLYFHDQSRLLD